ncbi:hypothetical protein RHMOL_Rhmol07G0068600 [Rhododendron molle]|uniref:Uncharacterized protein n=1 Tax=Rhododendron molle TaxID=49168 RepID=A0ACC0MXW2_RHOML|nr:hypothetical protein RHMOL_Rhmol07G0068600 [Rhododendron molle]
MTSTRFSSVLGTDACLVFRERSESGDDTDTGYGRSKERRRVKELELVSLYWDMQRKVLG